MKPNCYGKYNQFSLKCLECKIGKLCRDKQSENRNNKLKQITTTQIKRTRLEYDDKYLIIKVPIDSKKFKHMENVKVTIEKINRSYKK